MLDVLADPGRRRFEGLVWSLAKKTGTDMTGWTVQYGGHMPGTSAYVAPEKRRLVYGRTISMLDEGTQTITALHELTHVRQFTDGRLGYVVGRDDAVVWEGETTVLPRLDEAFRRAAAAGDDALRDELTVRYYSERPWEREAVLESHGSPHARVRPSRLEVDAAMAIEVRLYREWTGREPTWADLPPPTRDWGRDLVDTVRAVISWGAS